MQEQNTPGDDMPGNNDRGTMIFIIVVQGSKSLTRADPIIVHLLK